MKKCIYYLAVFFVLLSIVCFSGCGFGNGTWTNTGGSIKSSRVYALAYDAKHNLLYAGTDYLSVFEYDGSKWSNTGGSIRSFRVFALAYDAKHNMLYAGTDLHGVFKYDGSKWSNTGGGASSFRIASLAYDSTHNILYAGTPEHANDLGSPGRDDYFGYGRINAFSTISHVAATPGITSISPTSGYAGTTVTIKGGHFGSSRGSSYVKFGSKKCASSDYVSWGASQVKVKVPTGTAVGTQKMTLTTASGISNAKTFTINAKPKPPPPNVESSTWYLAEGSTNYGFDTYITIQNPNTSAVTAQITYMTGSGAVTAPSVNLPAKSQATINPKDKLGESDFSTKVVCKEGKAIAVDRTMSWTGPGDSVGMASAHSSFYLPDGQTSEGRETYTLVQNPNSSAVTVQITYMTPTGAGNKTFTDTIPANSRMTYNMADKAISGRAAIMVTSKTSGKKIMCERAMYWNARGAGTDTIGGYSD